LVNDVNFDFRFAAEGFCAKILVNAGGEAEMSAFRLPSSKVCFLLVSASGCFSSGTALAQLTNYIAINPIDVCSPSGCAPINNSLQTVADGPNTPVGFVDTSSGTNLAQAMWNQIGVALAFSPVVRYDSAPNISMDTPKAYPDTDYLTLHIKQVPDPDPNAPPGSTLLQSDDFLILSQQVRPNGIYTGTVPNPTNPPNVPAASLANVVNLFFVETLFPPPDVGGVLYGFSWKNANGMSVSSNTFRGAPGAGPPRPDTVAHEIGHNLDVDHTTFGAGPDPSTGDCAMTPLTGCAANLMTAGGNPLGDLRTEPSSAGDTPPPPFPGGALFLLPNGTADQLNNDQQEPHVLLSGFVMNQLANSMVTADNTSTTSATAAVTTGATGLIVSSDATAHTRSKGDTSIFFDITGPLPGTHRPGETLVGLIVTLGDGVQFDPDNRVRFLANRNLVGDFDYDRGRKTDLDCPDRATECLLIDLKSPFLQEGQDLRFSQGIRKRRGEDEEGDYEQRARSRPVTLAALARAGLLITFEFSDGLQITSALNSFDSLGRLATDSQHPVSTVTPRINLAMYTSPIDPATGAPAAPCTLPTVDTSANSPGGPSGNTGDTARCLDPTVKGGADGDPREEGGQPRKRRHEKDLR
jgi:hypothetical protein